MNVAGPALLPRITPMYGRRGLRLLERNAMVYRRLWLVLLAGLLEPGLYLLGFGYGVGALIGTVGVDGRSVSYAAFVTPALIAVAAMNGAVYDTTFSLLHKLRYERIYDTMLATPMQPADIVAGEVGWALVRGSLYTTVIVAMSACLGLIRSAWALLALPAAALITFCFGALGCAVATYLRSWQDTENVNLAQMVLFLLSGTFFPVDSYPAAVRWLVELSPLTRGTDLVRQVLWGVFSPTALADIGYLAALGALGSLACASRLRHAVLE
jgi:lipooligosaccharide transport system permease protein